MEVLNDTFSEREQGNVSVNIGFLGLIEQEKYIVLDEMLNCVDVAM